MKNIIHLLVKSFTEKTKQLTRIFYFVCTYIIIYCNATIYKKYEQTEAK